MLIFAEGGLSPAQTVFPQTLSMHLVSVLGFLQWVLNYNCLPSGFDVEIDFGKSIASRGCRFDTQIVY